jgi:hypothetical protein
MYIVEAPLLVFDDHRWPTCVIDILDGSLCPSASVSVTVCGFPIGLVEQIHVERPSGSMDDCNTIEMQIAIYSGASQIGDPVSDALK